MTGRPSPRTMAGCSTTMVRALLPQRPVHACTAASSLQLGTVATGEADFGCQGYTISIS